MGRVTLKKTLLSVMLLLLPFHMWYYFRIDFQMQRKRRCVNVRSVGCSSSGDDVSTISDDWTVWADCEPRLPHQQFKTNYIWRSYYLGRAAASSTYHTTRLAARGEVWPWRRVHGFLSTGKVKTYRPV